MLKMSFFLFSKSNGKSHLLLSHLQPTVTLRVHRGILVARAVDGLRVFGCRSCPAPLSVRCRQPCRVCEAVRSFLAASREAVKNRLYSPLAVPPCREYHRAEKKPRKAEISSRARYCVGSLIAVALCRSVFCPLSRVLVAVGIILPPKSEKPIQAKFEPYRIGKKKSGVFTLRLFLFVVCFAL